MLETIGQWESKILLEEEGNGNTKPVANNRNWTIGGEEWLKIGRDCEGGWHSRLIFFFLGGEGGSHVAEGREE